MIVRAATAVSFPVLFSSGFPDGDVDWEVRDQSGALLDSGSVTPAVGAVSIVVTVPAAANALGVGEFTSTRDVAWTYTTGAMVVNGEARYTVEALLPFGVSPEGVRSKLGVETTDLPDSEIELVTAYYDFQALVGEEVLDTVATEPNILAVRHAIEALAALSLIPSMSVRVASKESSGTNQFSRQKVDWLSVAAGLQGYVQAATILLVPTFDVTANFGPLLILATPDVDVFTG